MVKFIKMLFGTRKKSRYQDYDVDGFLRDEFFKDWVLNKASESDHFWDKWLLENPHKLNEVLRAKEIIKSIEYRKPVELEDDEYVEIFENILEVTPSMGAHRVFFQSKFFVRSAAIFLLVVLSVFLSNYPFNRTEEQQVVARELITKSTPKGGKLTFYLSDGSKVKLNSGSTITFASSFLSDSARSVFVEGEAYFEIAEDKTKPFIVRGKYLNAKVLGTSFNFKSDAQDAEVALVTGELEVSDVAGRKKLLKPKELIYYATDNLVKKGFDPERKIGWVYGKIYFERASSEEIFRVLEKWYGLKIVTEPGFRFRGDFSGEFNNESLKTVLDVIGRASGFSYEIKNNKTVVLKN